MPQENVEIVRAALTALRDLDRHAAAALFTPDAEWHNTSVFPGTRVCVGADAIVDFWATLSEGFEIAGEIEQVLDAEGRVVLGLHRWGTGRQSGVPFDVRYAAIFQLRDERIFRVSIHGSYADALHAAGLAE